MAFQEKLQNTTCVWKAKKKGVFVNTLRFGKIVIFISCKKRRKIEVTASKGENQKFKFLLERVFWGGVSGRLLTTCDPQKLCSAENTFYGVFSKHSLCRKKRV